MSVIVGLLVFCAVTILGTSCRVRVDSLVPVPLDGVLLLLAQFALNLIHSLVLLVVAESGGYDRRLTTTAYITKTLPHPLDSTPAVRAGLHGHTVIV